MSTCYFSCGKLSPSVIPAPVSQLHHTWGKFEAWPNWQSKSPLYIASNSKRLLMVLSFSCLLLRLFIFCANAQDMLSTRWGKGWFFDTHLTATDFNFPSANRSSWSSGLYSWGCELVSSQHLCLKQCLYSWNFCYVKYFKIYLSFIITKNKNKSLFEKELEGKTEIPQAKWGKLQISLAVQIKWLYFVKWNIVCRQPLCGCSLSLALAAWVSLANGERLDNLTVMLKLRERICFSFVNSLPYKNLSW